jgi:membrane protein DedA with SNARE-associated domain
MVQQFVEIIVTFVREHQSWAPAIAFMVAFGESLCFLSILWPGTAILVGITGLLAASGMDIKILGPTIIGAGLGGTLGYSISYWIGLYFKDSIANIWPFTQKPDLIPHGKNFFERYGAFGVFLGHFFGPVRAVIPVVAGMFAMKQLPFQIANILSAFIWAAGVIAPAFFLVTFKDEVFAFMLQYEWLVALLMFTAALLNAAPTPLMAVPTLLVFVILGALHLFAGGDLVLMFVAGLAGAFLGDIWRYFAGQKNPTDFHTVWPNSWSPESADQARVFLGRWGLGGIVLSKFRTTLRAFVPSAAGATGTPMPGFIVSSAVSAALWSAALLSVRYLIAIVMSI